MSTQKSYTLIPRPVSVAFLYVGEWHKHTHVMAWLYLVLRWQKTRGERGGGGGPASRLGIYKLQKRELAIFRLVSEGTSQILMTSTPTAEEEHRTATNCASVKLLVKCLLQEQEKVEARGEESKTCVYTSTRKIVVAFDLNADLEQLEEYIDDTPSSPCGRGAFIYNLTIGELSLKELQDALVTGGFDLDCSDEEEEDEEEETTSWRDREDPYSFEGKSSMSSDEKYESLVEYWNDDLVFYGVCVSDPITHPTLKRSRVAAGLV